MVRKVKKKAIVLDIDDTIVQFCSFLCFLHNNLHGTSVSHHDLKQWSFDGLDIKDVRGNRVTGKELKKTFRLYEPDGLYSILPVIKDARFAIKIMKELGYKIILMTARKKEFQRQTILNLVAHNIQYDEVYFTPSHDKAKKIQNISKKYNVVMFADDRYETVKDVNDKCKIEHLFLVNMPYNNAIELDPSTDRIQRINNLFEAIRHLEDVTD
jgi:uncharacterized HAD superfamily protein